MKNIYKCTECGRKTKVSVGAEVAMKQAYFPANLCICQINNLPNEGKLSDLPKSTLEFVETIEGN